MTPELTKLTWVLVLHMLCWIPYVLNRTMVQGLVDAVGYPDNPKPLAAWAERAKRAHYIVFTAGIPWLRTLSYFVGWLCTGALILQVLG